MCFKKNKNKVKKIKPHGASNFAGSFSIFAGILGIIATILLFFVYFLWGDSFLDSVFGMNEGLIVILFPFILVLIIIWAIFKLIFGGFMLSYLWISVILFFVAGGMMKSASANLGNIYSNKSNRNKAKTSMVLWWVIEALLGVGVFISIKTSGAVLHASDGFKIVSFCFIVFFAFLALICFIVAIIDFVKKSKRVKYNDKGQMIDDTYQSSALALGANTNQSIEGKKSDDKIICSACGGEIDATVQFCPNCGYKNENRKYKLGDVTEKGKVIGFNVNTHEPIFMPATDDGDKNNGSSTNVENE